MLYVDTKDSDIDTLKGHISLLVVTATLVETTALHAKLLSLPGQSGILNIHKGNQTYYAGIFGAYGVVHVQCDMGAVARGGSIITVKDAIADWSPKAVLMVGIAFGINRKTQKIGDVLISESIAPYDIKREGEEDVIFRSPIPASGAVFANRFKNFKGWEHTLPTGKKPKAIVGQLLSGETLIDNLQYRDKLLAAFPSAKGGEMEGAGVYAAAATSHLEWILIKSICDFADGKKGRNKQKNQVIAAESAVALCHAVMSSKMAFTALGFMPIENIEEKHESDPAIIKKVLFEVYSQASELYYIKRKIDDEILKITSLQSVWLTGDSGCGKTSIVYHALTKLTDKPLIISLANCVRDDNVISLFECFLQEVEDYFGLPKAKIAWSANSQIISHITQVLISNIPQSTSLFIYLDEIPIEDDALFREFIDMLLAIIMAYSCSGNIRARFLVSSIYDPKTCIKPFQRKAVEHIKIVDVLGWAETDLEQLVLLLSKELKISLKRECIDTIISTANGSPRFVKRFFGNYLMFSSVDSWSIDRIMSETVKEVQL